MKNQADNFDVLKHRFRDASFIGFVAGLHKLRVFEVTIEVVKKLPLSYIQGDNKAYHGCNYGWQIERAKLKKDVRARTTEHISLPQSQCDELRYELRTSEEYKKSIIQYKQLTIQNIMIGLHSYHDYLLTLSLSLSSVVDLLLIIQQLLVLLLY